MVLTWEGVGAAYKRRKMKDRQESTEGSKQACVPELHNGCGTDTHIVIELDTIQSPFEKTTKLPPLDSPMSTRVGWSICGFHFGVVCRYCSRVFLKWEMMSDAGSTCEVKQPWIN
ncbi:unnamed protein product [Sphagnum compactum]